MRGEMRWSCCREKRDDLDGGVETGEGRVVMGGGVMNNGH